MHRVCRTPIGNLLAWLKHVTKESHRDAMQKNPAKVLGKEKDDEVIIASSPSVLHLFGDSCNFCLPCNLAVASSSALLSHEQLEQHKAAARAMELRDRDSLAKEASDFPTIFHCSLCNLSTSSLPSAHLTSAGHRRKEDETSPCLYCPTRVVPDSLTAHQKKFHPTSAITCNFCGEKFKLGGPALVAHANGHLHPDSVSTASETVERGVMAMPDDLRRMRCRKCGLQFLGQEITEVTNHVLAMHNEVEARQVIEVGVELSCQLCLMVCATEAELTEHIHSAHKNSPKKDADLCGNRRGQVVSVSGVKYKRYGSISPPPRSPRPRSRTRSPPSSYSNKKLAIGRRSPSYSTRSRSRSRSAGRRSRSHGRRSRSHGRRSRSYGRRSRTSQPRWSRSPGRRSRSPIRRSRSPPWRSRSPRPRSRTSPVKRRPRRKSSGGGGSPTYSPYRRPSTPPTPRSRSPSPQIVGHGRRSGWARTSSYGGGSSRRWRSPTPPPRPEPVLSLEEREERKEEESKLLERLRNDKSKELSANDLREKLESKKCVMLDSRGEVKVEGSGTDEKRACPICSNKFNDDSLLLQHMKMEHRRDMFGCSKCQGDKQPAIGWSMEVLVQHLASAHELNVTISEAISGFLAIPESLHKVTCKLCPPPHILGSQGFWLAGDVSEHMVSIEEHFEQVELLTQFT